MLVAIVAVWFRGDQDWGTFVGRAVGFFGVWWLSFFGFRVLDEFLLSRSDQEDIEAVRADPISITAPAGNERTLEASIEALTAYIGRMDTSIDRTERTAAFVPATIGVIATIAVQRLDPGVKGLPLYLGFIAASFAMRALFDSIRCLSQHRMAGVSGYGEFWKVDRPYPAFQAGRINALIDAVRQSNSAAAEKRRTLRLALTETGLAVFFLVVFAVFGGFAPVT
jgi:hypothetical protein